MPFRSAEEAREKGRKGGKKSGQVRREKRTIQNILADYLKTDARDNPNLAKLADALGLETEGSVKSLVVLACILRTIEEGDISDLEKLMSLLGEQKETNSVEEKVDTLLKEFRDAIK